MHALLVLVLLAAVATHSLAAAQDGTVDAASSTSIPASSSVNTVAPSAAALDTASSTVAVAPTAPDTTIAGTSDSTAAATTTTTVAITTTTTSTASTAATTTTTTPTMSTWTTTTTTTLATTTPTTTPVITTPATTSVTTPELANVTLVFYLDYSRLANLEPANFPSGFKASILAMLANVYWFNPPISLSPDAITVAPGNVGALVDRTTLVTASMSPADAARVDTLLATPLSLSISYSGFSFFPVSTSYSLDTLPTPGSEQQFAAIMIVCCFALAILVALFAVAKRRARSLYFFQPTPTSVVRVQAGAVGFENPLFERIPSIDITDVDEEPVTRMATTHDDASFNRSYDYNNLHDDDSHSDTYDDDHDRHYYHDRPLDDGDLGMPEDDDYHYGDDSYLIKDSVVHMHP
eukprot:m.246960 g.246960  ORF g.246960 m.246960 type:complete len:408 (+) comp15236_c0_seq1:46-1269(+)